MASGAAKNKTLEQNDFCTRMTFSESLTVIDGTFKLDYASFVHPVVQIDET